MINWYFSFFFPGSENGKPCSQDIKFWCFCTNHSKFPRKIFKGSRMQRFRQTKGWSISKGQLQYINNIVMLFKPTMQWQGINKWLYNKTVWPINYFNGRWRKDASKESLIRCSYCHTLGLFEIKMSNENLLRVAWSCCKVQQFNLSTTVAFRSGQKKVAIEKGVC